MCSHVSSTITYEYVLARILVLKAYHDDGKPKYGYKDVSCEHRNIVCCAQQLHLSMPAAEAPCEASVPPIAPEVMLETAVLSIAVFGLGNGLTFASVTKRLI